MRYVYHGVPEKMEGSELIPLVRMQSTHPELYTKYIEKYQGREEIMQRKVPLLDCLWNDVVQFLPVHPLKVFKLQVELGIIPSVPDYKYFEIDSNAFDLNRAVVFFKTASGEENTVVKWLRDVNLAEFQEVPQATIDYFTTLVGTGELPFNYQFIPHVLYQGGADVSKASIISLGTS